MKYPLLVFTAVFCAGIWTGDRLQPSFWPVFFLGIFMITVAIAFFPRERLNSVLLGALVFLLGIARCLCGYVIPSRHVSQFIFDKGPYLVNGSVAGEAFSSKEGIAFFFEVREIESLLFRQKANGRLLVRLETADCPLPEYGQRLILAGTMRDSRNYFKKSGDRRRFSRGPPLCVMTVRSCGQVRRIGGNDGFFVRRIALFLKQRIVSSLSQEVNPVAAGILCAMTLGERANIPPALVVSMMKSGTVHILVVSGFNVGIVCFIILLLLKIFGLRRSVRGWCAAVLVILYCFMTGASTPVVRATVMAIAFLFAPAFEREPRILNFCGAAALAIVLVDPNQLYDIGFQLSFASVLSIIILYPFFCRHIPLATLRQPVLRSGAEAGLVSLSAWLGTAGFIAYYFKLVSPVTLLANIFIVPVATFITLTGFCLVAAKALCPIAAPFFGQSAEGAVILLIKMNQWFVTLPGAYFYLR